MVTKWGLSDELGPLLYSEDEGEVFLGRSAASQSKSVSSDTAKAIDKEVRKIIDECYAKAEQILEDNRDILEMMKDALIEYETIDSDQIDDIMDRKKPGPPAGWEDSDDDDADANKVEKEQTEEKSDKGAGPIGGPAGEH